VTLSSTQDFISNKAFYVLQSPEEGLFWGPLAAKTGKACGRFVDFNKEEVVYLGPSQAFDALSILKDINEVEAFPDFKAMGGEVSYKNRFKAFKASENVQKAVLYETFIADFDLTIECFLSFLRTLLIKQHEIGGYIYGFYDFDNKRALLGLTPEYLYKTDCDENIWTTAVAGSQKASDFKAWSKKLINEHKLVEEGIKNSLGDLVEFSKSENLNYGDLVHLSSKGKVSGLVECLSDKLHPTAAVGTLPKDSCTNLDLGPRPRGFYGGFAELNDVNLAFSLVTIRGLEWKNSKLKASIGGGVLKDSLLDEECNEIAFKWKQFQKLWM